MIPLEIAMLCLDCQVITARGKHPHCEFCGSRAVLSLAKVLGVIPSQAPAQLPTMTAGSA